MIGRILPDRLNAATITLLYALFASLWIVSSGLVLTYTTSDPALQDRIELIKGLAFVAVSSGLLYLLMKVWHEPKTATNEIDIISHDTARTYLILFFVLLSMIIPLTGLVIFKVYASQIEQYEHFLATSNILFWFSLAAVSVFTAACAAGLLLWRQQRHIQQLEYIAEQARTDQILKHFYEMPFIGMAMLNAESRDWVKFNDRLCEIVGYSREELQQKNLQELIYPEDRSRFIDNFNRLLQEYHNITTMEGRLLCKDNSIAYINIDVDCTHLTDGSLEYYFVLIQDTTNRRKAEIDRLASEQRYRTLVQVSPEIIFINRKDRIEFINNTGLELLGASSLDQVIGHLHYEFFHQDDHPVIRERIRQMSESPCTVPMIEKKMRALDGSLIDVESVASSFEEAGELLIQIICRDIRKRKHAERELLTLNRELEQRIADRTASLERTNVQLQFTNKELETYSYSVSHDLRAPLRAINGFSEILKRRHSEQLPAEAQHYLDNIIEAGSRMDRLIDDLLNYSRIGHRSVTLQKTSLSKVLEEACEDLADRIKHAGIQLAVPAPDELPLIYCNQTLLHQIFVNLLSNAVTYHRPDAAGGPRVRIYHEASPDGIIIHFEDNGIGIDPAYHEKIFEIFQRLHSDEMYIGTGIGLAIVKKAVTLLNGKVWLESIPGEGTTFSLQLPKRQA